ncbi:uncharacterized protein LOC144818959 [Lissotriton helveticus]
MDQKSVYALLFFYGMICTVACLTTTAPPLITDLTNGADINSTAVTTMPQTSQDNESFMTTANMTKPSNSDVNNATEPQNTTQNLLSLPTSDTENMTDIMTTRGSSAASSMKTVSVTVQPGTTDKKKPKSSSLQTALIILFVFIALILILALYCWLQHRKRERNSFNLYQASPDNADIPLSSDAVEKKTAENLREDKVDIHHIEPPSDASAAGGSPKQEQSSHAADAHEGDLNSTASTVPKDDEPDRLSLDSSQASLLPPGTGNLKTQETDQAEDSSHSPSSGLSVESPSRPPNENNNNSNKWTIHQLKNDERETFMRADREENKGKWSADAPQADIAKLSSFSDISLRPESWSAEDKLLETKA